MKDIHEESLEYSLNHESATIREAFEEGVKFGKAEAMNEFQILCMKTSKYNKDEQLMCCTLGLTEEAGEVAGKVNKWIRKNHDIDIPLEYKEKIGMELFDVMWNVSAVADSLGLNLNDIANKGLAKLADREDRNQVDNINGGDER